MTCTRTYTIKQLAELAGISARTLRHYDQIGLLIPKRMPNGYRIYDEEDVRLLQYILLLRACKVPLSDIAGLLTQPDLDLHAFLLDHLTELRRQKMELETAIAAVEQAVNRWEGYEKMDDQQKFEELKRRSIDRFEEEYGLETRERYGSEAIDAANERMLNMSKLAWDAKEELERRIKDHLILAMKTGDPRSEEACYVAEMHAQWIRIHWGEGAYTPEAHRQLAGGYLADPRFIEYYDGACGEGATKFLHDIIITNVH